MTILVSPTYLRHPPKNASKTWLAWSSPPEFVTTHHEVFVVSIALCGVEGATHTKCGKSWPRIFPRSVGCGDRGDYGEDVVTSYARSWRSMDPASNFSDKSGLFPMIGRKSCVFHTTTPDYTGWTCMVACFCIIIHPPLTNCCRRRHHSSNSSSSRMPSNLKARSTLADPHSGSIRSFIGIW